MKGGFFSKIAWTNIRKNNRFYVPRILAEAGLLGCFYISMTLALDERLSKIKGGSYIPTFMFIGLAVLAILSAVLVLYTNSFLMKQRKKEFGLYNVLGMEKKHVARVLFRESVISCAFSEALGLCFGILFYKLCSLLVCRLLHSTVLIGFDYIKLKTILPSAAFFLLLDLLTYLYNRVGIAKMRPVELLASKAAGEKEPKIKWILLVIGAAALGAGYFISLTTDSPFDALGLFFLAVILVIIGTYCLFVSGSIFVLKVLKRNRHYYYSPKHMPSVSGLLYRMKQNAVGLASIAILATGVLVMISTTVSLYSGMQGTLDKNYPQHLYVGAQYQTADGQTVSFPVDALESLVMETADQKGLAVASVEQNEYLEVSYLAVGNEMFTDQDSADQSGKGSVGSELTNFTFITEDVYSQLTGESLNLEENEIAVARISTPVANIRSLSGTVILQGTEYRIVRQLSYFPISNQVLASAFTTYGIVMRDADALSSVYEKQHEAYGPYASEYTARVAVTFEDPEAAGREDEGFRADLLEKLNQAVKEQPDYCSTSALSIDSYWNAKTALLGMYGTLLFLGILLGSVCLFATVLIIYYKQISEGYEDRERYQIMKKIGMSEKEVNQTIRSQVLLVFFLPLGTAGVHFAFAYPLLTKLLKVLMLYKSTLFLTCSLVTFAVFALVYVLIFSATSKAYSGIVR